jgi:mono/diheme cytochrome c family protein
VVFCLLLLAPGCRKAMYDQPRYKPLAASTLFDEGTSARPLEPGTIPRGQLRADELLETGRINGELADRFPFPIDQAAMERGQQRYMIFCTPCHGDRGDGRGMIVQRGFPPPPPFYGRSSSSPTGSEPTYADLREAPVGHFFDVMTHGHGVMYSYASRVSVEDRWKIAAYIRALQLSQYATADELRGIADPTDEERRMIEELNR